MRKINPIWWFLNDDNKKAPNWYLPHSYGIWRELSWLIRNPLHNFTFYIVGVTDKQYTVKGMFPDSVFNPQGRWKYHIVQYKWLKLPFVSYCGQKINFILDGVKEAIWA